MGIPVKGSRRIEVDGGTYRYLIRRDRLRSRRDHVRARTVVSGCRVLTVQKSGKDNKPGGQVLQVKLYTKIWIGVDDEEDRAEEVTLTPEEVRQVIRLAHVRGWDPTSGGVFTGLQVQLENWETGESTPNRATASA